MTCHELNLPDLGLDDVPIVLSMWLARRGGRVAQGEPIAEILAGAVTVDLPAPADGVLSETLVSADESIRVGQRLAVIESP
jgi:2-oxoglutarate dehydrogenase E2 component (dihydrolipoamide succinyltransferase)